MAYFNGNGYVSACQIVVVFRVSYLVFACCKPCNLTWRALCIIRVADFSVFHRSGNAVDCAAAVPARNRVDDKSDGNVWLRCLFDHEFFGETALVRALTRDGNNVSTGANGFAAKIEPAGRARFYRITCFEVGVPDKRSAKGRLLRRFVVRFCQVGNGHKLVGYCFDNFMFSGVNVY